MVALRWVLVCAALLFFAHGLHVGMAVAQNDSQFESFPLRPATTSSPRATLRSFNTNANLALRAWQAGEPRETLWRLGASGHKYAGLQPDIKTRHVRQTN